MFIKVVGAGECLRFAILFNSNHGHELVRESDGGRIKQIKIKIFKRASLRKNFKNTSEFQLKIVVVRGGESLHFAKESNKNKMRARIGLGTPSRRLINKYYHDDRNHQS